MIKKPVERGWGIRYQADVVAKRMHERQQHGAKEGEVFGEEESLMVLGLMDQARRQAGIVYDAEIVKV